MPHTINPVKSSKFHIPKTISQTELSSEWFNKFMPSPKVIKTQILGNASAEGFGYLGQLTRICLTRADKSVINVVLKTLPTNPQLRKIAIGGGFAKCEIQFYRELLPDLQSFLLERNVPEEYQFRVPKCYLAEENDCEDDEYLMILVLEDLVESGFEQWRPGVKKDLDSDKIKSTLREIALFHATSIGFGIRHGITDYLDVYSSLCDYKKQDETVQDYLDDGFQVIYDILGDYPEEAIPSGFMEQTKYLRQSIHNIMHNKFIDKKYPYACLRHNDMHAGNLFYSQNSSGPLKSALIDFQICLGDGNFMNDVAFFLLCCTDLSNSTSKLAENIEYYHRVFIDSFYFMNIEFEYSLEQIYKDFRNTVLLSLLHIVSGARAWCIGNNVSKNRVIRALFWAYKEKLLEYKCLRVKKVHKRKLRK